MLALHVWADRWSDDDHVLEIDFVDVFKSQSLAKAAVMSKEGNRLDPSEIKVVAKTENAKNYLEKYKTKPARPESKEEAA